jgi:hypothetical protein
LKDTAEHSLDSLGETGVALLDLDAATIARFAEMVDVSGEEQQAQFAEDLLSLRKKAFAWALIKVAQDAKADAPLELTPRERIQNGANRQSPAHRASPAFRELRERNADVARTGRQFIRALAARRAAYPSDPTSDGARQLEDLVAQTVRLAKFLSGVKPGRPRRPRDKTELERIAGVLEASIARAGGRPTLTRHHHSGNLVELLTALRPYLPAGFIPEDLDEWPWAKLERLKTAQNRRRSATSSAKTQGQITADRKNATRN